MTSPPGFAPPVQRRSRETLRRMVDAAHEALDETSFDRLTLSQLTERAGVTVGAFYQRFPSKAAFLEYLEEDAYREIRESGARLFGSWPPRRGHSVREYVRAFVSGMAAIYREHRGVLRELVQRSRSDEVRQQRRMDLTRDVVGTAVEWILAQGGPIGHPDPRRALGVALLFTSSALRDVVLFDESWASDASSAAVEDLVEELVRAAAAYLELPEE